MGAYTSTMTRNMTSATAIFLNSPITMSSVASRPRPGASRATGDSSWGTRWRERSIGPASIFGKYAM